MQRGKNETGRVYPTTTYAEALEAPHTAHRQDEAHSQAEGHPTDPEPKPTAAGPSNMKSGPSSAAAALAFPP